MATAQKKVTTDVILQLTEKEARALRDIFSHVSLGRLEVDAMRTALDKVGIKYRFTKGVCEGNIYFTNLDDDDGD